MMEGALRYCTPVRLLALVALLLAACASVVGAATAPVSLPGLQGAANRLSPRANFASFSLPDDALWEGFLTPGLSWPQKSFVTPHFTEYHGQLLIWGDIHAAGDKSASGVVL